MAVVTAEAEGVAVPTEGAVDGVEEAAMDMREVKTTAAALVMAVTPEHPEWCARRPVHPQ